MEKIPQTKHDYIPEHLIDELKARLKVHSDSKLAKMLNVSPAVISRIRHRQSSISGTLLIRIQELTSHTIAEVRSLMGDRRRLLRMSTDSKHRSDRMKYMRVKQIGSDVGEPGDASDDEVPNRMRAP